MRKYINDSFKHFLHGGDYNPEQWMNDKSVWDEDMRLMARATEEYIINQMEHSYRSLDFYKSVIR